MDITTRFVAVDFRAVLLKTGLVVAWLAAICAAGAVLAGAALGFATQHVHDVNKTTVNNIVHVTHHNFDHSTAGIVAVSGGVGIVFILITIGLTALAITAWQDLFE